MGVTELAILMIATNRYLELWMRVAEELNQLIDQNEKTKIKMYLFTNRVEDASNWIMNLRPNFRYEIIEIPPLKWPYATLLRFEIFHEFKSKITEELLMYLDSDMKITGRFWEHLEIEKWKSDIALVRHPGYIRPNFLIGIKTNLIKYSKIKMIDIRNLLFARLKNGAWEKNPNSTAFVPMRKQKIYFHGAVFFGKNESFLKMCEVLALRIKKDLKNNFIATWHDESHLNWYAANHQVQILDNRFSYLDNQTFTNNLENFISTPDKDIIDLR